MTNEAPFVLCLNIADLAALREFAASLARILRAGDAVLLSGPLGAGKTALARYILQGLGVREEITSPTFNLVHEYELPPGATAGRVWHVDLYRLNDPQEAVELGLEDAFRDTITLVEWPDRLGEWRPEDPIEIEITPCDAGPERQVRLAATGSTAERLRRARVGGTG